MKVLFLSAEATPYVKRGGLADVAGVLPGALRQLGHDVRLMMPAYKLIDREKWGLRKQLDTFTVEMDWRREPCQLWINPRTGDRFITNYYFYDNRDEVYGYGDDVEQFVLFCRAAIEACRLEGWTPDVIHANDWHTAAAVRLAFAQGADRPALVFTIHNMAHQGNQRPFGWPLLGVFDGQGNMNLMQQAIWSADIVSTVSPTYAQEILTPEGGCGLDWALREKGDRVMGILNGIDVKGYNPATDGCLAANYSKDASSNKAICKEHLQYITGLENNPGAPLIGVVSRLDFQKGIGLILDVIDRIVEYSNAQIMVLGSGNPQYQDALRTATSRFPGRVANYIGFDDKLARQVYAGSDIFLMPSLFEPCGLSQLLAMRYGSLPLVRSTGGLRDTVIDMRYNPNGCGYRFDAYDKEAMMEVLFAGALHDYNTQPEKWQRAVVRAMSQEFGWDKAAREYVKMYERAVSVKRQLCG